MKKEPVGQSRQEFNRVHRLLTISGYDGKQNIVSYWQSKEDAINNTAYGIGGSGPFGIQIKWQSEVGKVIQKSVWDYLKAKDKEGLLSYEKVIEVDFSDWKYTFDGTTITIKEYRKIKIKAKNGITNELLDFSGIDLSGISVSNCMIKNCTFESAFFDKSRFDGVSFKDCSLDKASFYKARLSSVDFEGQTSIRSTYFDAAWFENIGYLNNETVAVPFIYTEIKYGWLLKQLFKKAFCKDDPKEDILVGQEHTTFISNNAEQMTLPHLKELKEYINWFQSLIGKLYNYKNLVGKRRFGFFWAAISTKYWSSFAILGLVAFIVDLLFSLGYFFTSESFSALNAEGATWWQTMIKSFYYSTVTFMTLGYGDVYPTHWCGQLAVIIEVTLGYTVLGLFVYLVSRKVDKMY
ncbi:MAG: pentapeptide repeat-containing protein [Sphingobacteriaceae bacterium]|nr:pentapeptide repeat-containing protein [Sphingobacteriaceae bacterium]